MGVSLTLILLYISQWICIHSVSVFAFSPGSIPFAAFKAADSSSQWFRCGWRTGAGSAGRSESGGGECRDGGVLSQVWYV